MKYYQLVIIDALTCVRYLLCIIADASKQCGSLSLRADVVMLEKAVENLKEVVNLEKEESQSERK